MARGRVRSTERRHAHPKKCEHATRRSVARGKEKIPLSRFRCAQPPRLRRIFDLSPAPPRRIFDSGERGRSWFSLRLYHGTRTWTWTAARLVLRIKAQHPAAVMRVFMRRCTPRLFEQAGHWRTSRQWHPTEMIDRGSRLRRVPRHPDMEYSTPCPPDQGVPPGGGERVERQW